MTPELEYRMVILSSSVAKIKSKKPSSNIETIKNKQTSKQINKNPRETAGKTNHKLEKHSS